MKSTRIQRRVRPGFGSHWHPRPRDAMPMHLMNLVGNKSSLQQTLSRLANPHVAAPFGGTTVTVVASAEPMLVLPQRCALEMQRSVGHLNDTQWEATGRQRVHRPWGYFDSLAIGERFQVKCIVVSPGARLSLQKHFHRAEHWVVVQGTAEATINDRMTKVYENESIYIPMGAIHRLANPGKIPLMIVEVQSGSYLGEDDIVRLEDDYQRCADDAAQA